MKKIRLFVFGLLIFPSPYAAASGYPPEPTSNDFSDCDKRFQYKAKLINPRIVQLFEGFESDSGLPAVNSVDIAAAYNTNQFYLGNVKYSKNGAGITFDIPGGAPRTEGYFHYDWIGRMKNGLHAVISSSNGGGTLVTTTLFFFRCSKAEGWRPIPTQDRYPKTILESSPPHQEKYSRVLLTLDRFFPLPSNGTSFSIDGNKFKITFDKDVKPITKVISVD